MQRNKQRSLGINVALNAIKSGLSILFPLITYPYAFRVLHIEAIGKVNYAISIVNYFQLIAALGITTYAIREGARLRDKTNEFKKFCNQIFTINIISTLISYGLLCAFVIISDGMNGNKELLTLLSLTIIFSTLGIDWINIIFEDFLFITIRSIMSYIITLFLLFMLVKNESDYMAYAFLTVAQVGMIAISNWIYCRKYIKIKPTSHMNLQKHIKPVLTIFANAVATSIYVNADTTMLGIYAGNHYVGLYALAVKVYSVIKTMMAAVYSAAIPRISFYIGQEDSENVKNIITKMCATLTIILFPAGIGLAAIAREVVLIMGGNEYLEATFTLQILSVSLIGAILGGAITYCINIPMGRELVNAKATTISAVLNIGLNLIAIPVLKQNGAAITTLISEFFVFIYCFVTNKEISNYIDLRAWIKSFIHAMLGCATIIIVSILIKGVVYSTVVRILSIVVLSVVFYIIELCLLKNEIATSVFSTFSQRGR